MELNKLRMNARQELETLLESHEKLDKMIGMVGSYNYIDLPWEKAGKDSIIVDGKLHNDSYHNWDKAIEKDGLIFVQVVIQSVSGDSEYFISVFEAKKEIT